MYNQVTLVGHLGSEVEMRYTPTGTAVANLNLAVGDSWTDRSTGERKDKTVWVRVTCWQKTAEIAAQYLHKGSRVLVVGQLEAADAFIGQDGQARASTKVTAREIKFMDRNPNGGNGSGSSQTEPHWSTSSAPTDEDVPF